MREIVWNEGIQQMNSLWSCGRWKVVGYEGEERRDNNVTGDQLNNRPDCNMLEGSVPVLSSAANKHPSSSLGHDT